MSDDKGLKSWLWKKRNVTRLAFVMQIGVRMLTSLLSLVWIRLIVGTVGADFYGIYIGFQKVITLGGLGDLGMGGAVGIRVGQDLGRGRDKELQGFLAGSRAIFLVMAVLMAVGVMAFSPWLPHWLHWKTVPGVGSLTLLFMVAAILMAGVIAASYLNNLNYACGNVTWPILPAFLLLQIATLGTWLLARQHVPLWVQVLPFLGSAAMGLWLTRTFVRITHPALAGMKRMHFDWSTAVTLCEGSFWVYLCGLGNAVYRSTDALVINAGSRFDAGTPTWYDNNYKFCEIAVFLALSASFVSLPKITQWMSSPDPAERERAGTEIRRLNHFQILLGCGAALAYLAGNDLFMHIWWRHKEGVVPVAPLIIQLAFALNMAITASGDTGVQIAIRSGSRGMRVAGTMIACTAILNLALAIWAMKRGSLPGIALATVTAQSALNLLASFYTCRQLKMNWLTWAFGSWLFPISAVLLAGWLRFNVPFDSARNVLIVLGAYGVMVLVGARILGINLAVIRSELAIAKSFLKH